MHGNINENNNNDDEMASSETSALRYVNKIRSQMVNIIISWHIHGSVAFTIQFKYTHIVIIPLGVRAECLLRL